MVIEVLRTLCVIDLILDVNFVVMWEVAIKGGIQYNTKRLEFFQTFYSDNYKLSLLKGVPDPKYTTWGLVRDPFYKEPQRKD